MQMSPEVVAAMNAAFADATAGWAFIAAHENIHTELRVQDQELVERQARHVTVVLENEMQGKMLVAFLEGDAGQPASTLSIVLNGSKLTTTDATLIQRFENAIPLLTEQVQAAAVEYFSFSAGE